MTENSLKYIIGVLKGEKPTTEPEWYEVLGFAISHRIGGLFYRRANRVGAVMPPKMKKIFGEIFAFQKRRVEFMREQIREISDTLLNADVGHILLKGSVLSNLSEESRIYEDGERISNDIDILVKSTSLTTVAQCLKNKGFIQGKYMSELKKVEPFTRLEVLTRRMNRGETAPFLKAADNSEFPFIEVDINFSLGNVPGERDGLLSEMIETRKRYEGIVSMSVADEEMFFLHLIMHQYKESCLYFMVEKGKELDLYKLADMYYLWKSDLFDKKRLKSLAQKYGVQKETGTVLGQVGRIFEDGEILSAAEEYGEKQPEVVDYEHKKKYLWTADERERIRCFDGKTYLREVKENDR